jgi:SPP1 family predicted phage head-tail adaptor
MKCATIKKVKSKICVSDFDKRIKIQTSQKVANNAPNTAGNITFTTIATLWAMIKTSPINEFINGVNVSNGTNIDFYIRYTNSIDFRQQLFIEYKDKLYSIQPIENIDEQDKIIRLRAQEKGDKNINANKR